MCLWQLLIHTTFRERTKYVHIYRKYHIYKTVLKAGFSMYATKCCMPTKYATELLLGRAFELVKHVTCCVITRLVYRTLPD